MAKKITKKTKTTKKKLEVKKTAPKSLKKTVAKRAIPKKTEKTLMEKFQTHEKDSGSTEVQIVVLTERIEALVKHLKKHPKDHDSRRGLLLLVGRRRRLLNYLKKTEEEKYGKIIGELGLKK